MTIPANDAFTLTSHSDSTPSLRSSRSRSHTRSPSPKIAFSAPQHLPNGEPKRRSSRRQRKSNGFVAESVKLADVDEALERTLIANGYTNGSTHQNGITRKVSPVKKIDWEIPRKALHSSIGTSCDSIHLISPKLIRSTDWMLHTYRFCDALPLRLSWIARARCGHPFRRDACHCACRYSPAQLPPFRARL